MLVSFLSVAAALVVIIGAGWALLRFLLRGEIGSTPPVERWGLAWILGTGFVSLGVFTIGWVFRGAFLVAIITVLAALLYVGSRRHVPSPTTPPTPLNAFEWVCVVVLIGQTVFVLWWSSKVALGWDGLLLWEAKARVAFENGGVLAKRYFREPPFQGTHPRYPLYLPYTETWFYLWLGRADQAWVRVIGPMTYAAGTCVFAGAAQRLGLTRTAVFAAAVAFFFLPFHFAGLWNVLTGYADFPLGIVYLAAASRLPSLAGRIGSRDPWIIAVLAGLAAWVKQEGVYLWLILTFVATVILLQNKHWKRALLVPLPGILLVGVYSIYLGAMGASADPYYYAPNLENLAKYSDRIPTVLWHFWHDLNNYQSWSFLWIGALIGVLTLAARRKWIHVTAFGLTLSIPIFLYLWPFVLSAMPDFENHIRVALPRLLLQIAPTAMLAMVLTAPLREEKDLNSRD
jgi:hypothetical protein